MRPLVYILFAYVAGILSARTLELEPKTACILFLSSILILPVLYFLKRPFKSVFIIPCFFFLGVLAINTRSNLDLPSNHITNLMQRPVSVVSKDPQNPALIGYEDLKGVVLSSPEQIGSRTKVLIDTQWISRNGYWHRTSGKALITIKGRINAQPYDFVRILARLYRPENFGNPGEYDYKSHLNMSGIYVTGYVKNPSHFIVTGHGKDGYGLTERIARIRSSIRTFISSNSKENGVLNSLVIADKGGISRRIRQAYAGTGTSHILSISGLHMAIVGGFFYSFTLFLLKRCEYTLLVFNAKKVAIGVALLSVLLYATTAGFSYATQRAAGMAFVVAITLLFGRGYDIFNTLALAALAILAWTPDAIRDISFQLTFAAVLSIAYMMPRLTAFFAPEAAHTALSRIKEESRLKRFYRNQLLPALLVTLSASVGVSPILAYHFHRVALFGLLANLIAIPMSGAIILLALFSSAVSFLYEPAAALLLYPADLLTTALNALIGFFAALPFSSLWIPTPSLIEIALFYLICLTALNLKKSRHWQYALVVLTLCAITDAIYRNSRPDKDGKLTIDYISVGQGESELIRFPNGQTMLIDGGGVFSDDFDVGERLIAPYLWNNGISGIDTVVLTHAQRDHMAGLNFIARNFKINSFLWNGHDDLKELKETLSKKSVLMRVVSSPESFNIDNVKIDILNPPENKGAYGSTDPNDESVVILITYGKTAFLLTGDITSKRERMLLSRLGPLVKDKVVILKAGHHGSRYSSSAEFLKLTSPSTIVVSAGRDNSFGFPHAETIERFKSLNAKVYRTDLDGAITIKSDGALVSVSAYKKITENNLEKK